MREAGIFRSKVDRIQKASMFNRFASIDEKYTLLTARTHTCLLYPI